MPGTQMGSQEEEGSSGYFSLSKGKKKKPENPGDDDLRKKLEMALEENNPIIKKALNWDNPKPRTISIPSSTTGRERLDWYINHPTITGFVAQEFARGMHFILDMAKYGFRLETDDLKAMLAYRYLYQLRLSKEKDSRDSVVEPPESGLITPGEGPMMSQKAFLERRIPADQLAILPFIKGSLDKGGSLPAKDLFDILYASSEVESRTGSSNPLMQKVDDILLSTFQDEHWFVDKFKFTYNEHIAFSNLTGEMRVGDVYYIYHPVRVARHGAHFDELLGTKVGKLLALDHDRAESFVGVLDNLDERYGHAEVVAGSDADSQELLALRKTIAKIKKEKFEWEKTKGEEDRDIFLPGYFAKSFKSYLHDPEDDNLTRDPDGVLRWKYLRPDKSDGLVDKLKEDIKRMDYSLLAETDANVQNFDADPEAQYFFKHHYLPMMGFLNKEWGGKGDEIHFEERVEQMFGYIANQVKKDDPSLRYLIAGALAKYADSIDNTIHFKELSGDKKIRRLAKNESLIQETGKFLESYSARQEIAEEDAKAIHVLKDTMAILLRYTKEKAVEMAESFEGSDYTNYMNKVSAHERFLKGFTSPLDPGLAKAMTERNEGYFKEEVAAAKKRYNIFHL